MVVIRIERLVVADVAVHRVVALEAGVPLRGGRHQRIAGHVAGGEPGPGARQVERIRQVPIIQVVQSARMIIRILILKLQAHLPEPPLASWLQFVQPVRRLPGQHQRPPPVREGAGLGRLVPFSQLRPLIVVEAAVAYLRAGVQGRDLGAQPAEILHPVVGAEEPARVVRQEIARVHHGVGKLVGIGPLEHLRVLSPHIQRSWKCQL